MRTNENWLNLCVLNRRLNEIRWIVISHVDSDKKRSALTRKNFLIDDDYDFSFFSPTKPIRLFYLLFSISFFFKYFFLFFYLEHNSQSSFICGHSWAFFFYFAATIITIHRNFTLASRRHEIWAVCLEDHLLRFLT